MKLKSAFVTNFGSYKDLEFNFADQGLTLIQGDTGSGKSTLQDVASWILFGVTAKNGSVDDIRSWTSNGNHTEGTITLELQNTDISITRVRGTSAQNDLYWTAQNGEVYRGKDLKDTQKLLESKLGVTSEFYNLVSYYNEFSLTSSFFTSNAKDRRSLLETIAALQFPTALSEKTKVKRKELKLLLEQEKIKYSRLEGRLEQLNMSLNTAKASFLDQEVKKQRRLAEYESKSVSFDLDKNTKFMDLLDKQEIFRKDIKTNIERLTKELLSLEEQVRAIQPESLTPCITCGASPVDINETTRDALIDKAFRVDSDIRSEQAKTDPFQVQIDHVQQMKNHYSDQYVEEYNRINPFVDTMSAVVADIDETLRIRAHQVTTCDNLQDDISVLAQLYDIAVDLRTLLLKQAINELQIRTNIYLEKYFDAEIKVEFSAEDDDISIEIQKSGHACSYSQLSKGQRSLLKLCFSIAVMTLATEKSGTQVSTLFFDEALDGLDTRLKVKSFNLFSELEKSYSSIFIIDHSTEFKLLCNKTYHVSLEQDNSTIVEV